MSGGSITEKRAKVIRDAILKELPDGFGFVFIAFPKSTNETFPVSRICNIHPELARALMRDQGEQDWGDSVRI